MVAGHAALSGPEWYVGAGWNSLTGGTALRYVLIVLLPSLVLAAEAPPVPTGYDLFKLPVGEFRAYVAGIVEGQMLLGEALNVPQAVCVDPMVTRIELAGMVLHTLSRLPRDFLNRPARVVVFRVLVENTPCPGFTWNSGAEE